MGSFEETDEAEAKVAFHLRMRARGIHDLAVLRSFERVSRQSFVPRRYANLASRDLALPIDRGQTLDEPGLLAHMIVALVPDRSHRVLQIGAGTGYATAILAQLFGEIVALERYRSLAVAAQARLEALGIANATIAWGDGLDVQPGDGSFDGIIVHGVLDAVPTELRGRLTKNGTIVCALEKPEGQHVVSLTQGDDGAMDEISVCPSRLRPLVRGLAAT